MAMSTQFFNLLKHGHGRRDSADPLELANLIAREHGFAGLDDMLRAIEKDEVEDDVEREIFLEMGPLVDWALDYAAGRGSRMPQDGQELILALVDFICHFLFGYTREELEALQLDADVDRLLLLIEEAELNRMQRQLEAGDAAGLDIEEPAAPILAFPGGTQ